MHANSLISQAVDSLLCVECGHIRLNAAQASACCTMQGDECPTCATQNDDRRPSALAGVDAPHALYTLALQADARLSEVIRSRTGRDRWTLRAGDRLIPEVREAIHAKITADEAWITYLRTHKGTT